MPKSFDQARQDTFWAIQEAISAANSAAEFAYLTDVGDDIENPHTMLLRLLIDSAKDVRSLRNHRHVYGEDDYCVLCHADGRA
jgi:hypothetical protein